MRTTHTFFVSNVINFKNKLLIWANCFEEVSFLDSNSHKDSFSSFDVLLAVDSNKKIAPSLDCFKKLKLFQKETNDWLFGYLSYDLKNELENLKSKCYDGLAFPELYFFQPKRIIIIKENEVRFIYLNSVEKEAEEDFKTILKVNSKIENEKIAVNIKMRISKNSYYDKVNSFLKNIYRGNIYEANFCQEFYSENTIIKPVSTYLKFNQISTAPFAAFLKFDKKYLLSASPERYLKKNGNTILSQPIKGTAARAIKKEDDKLLKMNLEKNLKERTENIMITDLVRNDLSKIAKKGSVKVDELCKVYTFKQVHQMISTISAKVDKNINSVDIIKATFPMGSMTGAPKIASLQIIEELEETKRGLYSGAVGYFKPNGDFDFNVVIRSILYNENRKYVSYSVGSAITAKSKPDKEYQECLLKAKAMRSVLEDNKDA